MASFLHYYSKEGVGRMIKMKVFLLWSLLLASFSHASASAEEQLDFTDYLKQRSNELVTAKQDLEVQWLRDLSKLNSAIQKAQKKSSNMVSLEHSLPIFLSIPVGGAYLFDPQYINSQTFIGIFNELSRFAARPSIGFSANLFPWVIQLSQRLTESVQLMGMIAAGLYVGWWIINKMDEEPMFELKIQNFNDFYINEMKMLRVLTEKISQEKVLSSLEIENDLARLVSSIEAQTELIGRYSDMKSSMSSVKRIFWFRGPWDMSKAAGILSDAQARSTRDFLHLQVFKLKLKMLKKAQKEWKAALNCNTVLANLPSPR